MLFEVVHQPENRLERVAHQCRASSAIEDLTHLVGQCDINGSEGLDEFGRDLNLDSVADHAVPGHRIHGDYAAVVPPDGRSASFCPTSVWLLERPSGPG